MFDVEGGSGLCKAEMVKHKQSDVEQWENSLQQPASTQRNFT